MNQQFQTDLLEQAQKLVNSVGIPSQPKIVLEIFELIDQPNCSFKNIGELVSKDVGLAAKTIKIANSAFFAPPKPIESVVQAISMLGLDNFYQLILSSALQEAMAENAPEIEGIKNFWSHSVEVAGICKMLVENFNLQMGEKFTEHHAYMAGLFHDCAIPLLMKKFPNYKNVIGLPIQNNPLITNDENIYFHTNHSLAGYLVSRSWKLPKMVCNAIRYHHDMRLIDKNDWVSRRLAAVLFLAEHIWQDTKMTATTENDLDPDQASFDEFLYDYVLKDVMEEISLKPQEFEDFKTEVFELF
jgi:HD-like signal output (HDOD) protein